MKQVYLLIIILVTRTSMLFSQACNFISPTVELNFITTPVPGFCDINFNLSFEINQNSGNKYTFVHLWRTADYQAWITNPSYDAYSSNQNTQPEFNNPGGESLNILQNALATIVLNNDNSPITFESSYGPDVDAPVKNTVTNPGITVVRQVLGANYRYTISNIVVRIATPPGGCTSSLSFTGDAWSSQANNGNPPIHCSMTNWSFTINDVQVAGFRACELPLKYNIGITTQSTTPFNVFYDIYVDDGDHVFNSATDYLVVNDNGPHSISQSTGYSAAAQSFDDPNSPYSGIAYKNNSFWYVVTAPTIFSNLVLYEADNSCATLPVVLGSFLAARNGDRVRLNWETMTEINSSGFSIERNDGNEWKEVGFVRSQAPGGSSSDKLSYQFDEMNYNRGISQYRIKMVNLDGTHRYSEVRTVKGENQQAGMIIYPNPSNNGSVKIQFDDGQSLRSIAVTDLSGKIIKSVAASRNSNVTITGLLPGLYAVKVTDLEKRTVAIEKLIITK